MAAHQTSPLQRRDPRRHLLRAGLAEGAASASRAPALLYAYCEERGIDARTDGKLIVAAERGRAARASTSSSGAGEANGVPGLRRVDVGRDRARSSRTRAGVAALHSPRPGVVDFARVAAAYAHGRRGGGGDDRHGRRGARPAGRGGASITVAHARGVTEAGYVVSCAGAWSDRLAVRGGRAGRAADRSRSAAATCGSAPSVASWSARSIYPVPDPDLPFLGGAPHADDRRRGPARPLGADGRRLATPTGFARLRRRDLRSNARLARHLAHGGRFWRSGLTEIRHAASKRAFVADAAPLRPRARHRATCCRDRPGSAPRRSTATVASSTTSSCIGPSARCTSATRPPRRRPRRWRWRS